MKIKNLVLGLMVMGSLTMVGCNDVKDTSEALRNQPTKKVEEKEVEKQEPKKEENVEKKEVEKQEPKKEEKGQCYDCGEYFPVKDMTFNGRSYHCGCVTCEACFKRIHDKKEVKTSLYTGGPVCKDCYEMEKNEKQYEETTEPEVTAPMCDRCGERPADYVESGLCNQCVESTGYEYGDEVEY